MGVVNAGTEPTAGLVEQLAERCVHRFLRFIATFISWTIAGLRAHARTINMALASPFGFIAAWGREALLPFHQSVGGTGFTIPPRQRGAPTETATRSHGFGRRLLLPR